jgi:hypothetical protein
MSASQADTGPRGGEAGLVHDEAGFLQHRWHSTGEVAPQVGPPVEQAADELQRARQDRLRLPEVDEQESSALAQQPSHLSERGSLRVVREVVEDER